ncbi:hypothetical protein CIG19_18820 [Enterobacterales bacterium CwR94]|nr:hypothetical protein CIG19_18820 [Enterobacterales bacterium CwR94]
MNLQIERCRQRLVRVKLQDMKATTNTHNILIDLPDGSITTVELTEEILEKALIKLFEAMVYDTNKREKAEIHIIQTYQRCVSKKFDTLTNTGNEFISAVIENLTEQAFQQRGKE